MKGIYFFFAAGLLFSPVSARAEVVNGIDAIVHDSVITRDEVENLIPTVIYRTYANQPDVLEKKIVAARSENLELLVSRQLILHDFKTSGYNSPESILDDEVQSRIREKYEDRVKLAKMLQAEGTTKEKFRQQVREQIIISVLRQKNISASLIISPHKVEAYYLAHKDEFKIQDELKLRRIVLNKGSDAEAARARTLGEEIVSRLKEGASFTDMASLYSQGPEKKDGGMWGWVEGSVLRKELADAAMTLKPGEHSGVIDTPEACYILLVEDKRVAHVKTLGEIREIIERNLLTEERGRLEKQWMDRLKKKTFVRYF